MKNKEMMERRNVSLETAVDHFAMGASLVVSSLADSVIHNCKNRIKQKIRGEENEEK